MLLDPLREAARYPAWLLSLSEGKAGAALACVASARLVGGQRQFYRSHTVAPDGVGRDRDGAGAVVGEPALLASRQRDAVG